MKRATKKHLSLVLAVLMLLTSVGFNVIAADNHQHKLEMNNPQYYKVVNPTCEDRGYTEFYCVFCDEVADIDNYKDALGHQFGDYMYEEVEGGFNKYQVCTREYTYNGELVTCGAKSYDMDGDKKALYHSVTFINNKVTASLDPEITYTDVAKEFKSEELYTCYVKHGEAAVFEGKNIPYRGKTVNFSSYEYIGWTEDSTFEPTEKDNGSDEKCFDLSKITKNTVLYPVFVGYNTTHMVVFYNSTTNITYPQNVVHGKSAKFSYNGDLYSPPPKKDDIVNYYKFTGWSTERNQTSGISNDVIETIPIYGDVHFFPTYEPVAKRYTLEFYDESGKNLLKYKDGYAVFNYVNLDVNFYENEKPIYEEILNFSKTKLSKQGDKTYYYEWTGKWKVMRADDTIGGFVDFSDFKMADIDIIYNVDSEGNTVYFPDDFADDGITEDGREPSKTIRLVPVFDRRLVVYTADIEMLIPNGEDEDYFRGDAVVHVVANNGQLVASGKTDAKGMFRCDLNYQAPFTVTIATSDSKYVGTAQIYDLNKPANNTGNIDDEAQLNKCRVQMELNPEYISHCSCIHHNALLQPIFVRLLNILYTFFNVKYVCCYDMAATIGPLLDYVDDSGNVI